MMRILSTESTERSDRGSFFMLLEEHGITHHVNELCSTGSPLEGSFSSHHPVTLDNVQLVKVDPANIPFVGNEYTQHHSLSLVFEF